MIFSETVRQYGLSVKVTQESLFRGWFLSLWGTDGLEVMHATGEAMKSLLIYMTTHVAKADTDMWLFWKMRGWSKYRNATNTRVSSST